MQEIFTELVEFAGADYAVFYSSVGERCMMRHGIAEGSKRERQIGKLAKRVGVKGQKEGCENMEGDELFRRLGSGSFICYPLLPDNGDVLGAVFLGCRRRKPFPELIEKRVKTLSNAYYAQLRARTRSKVESETAGSSERLERYLTMGLRFGDHKIVGIDPVMEENVFGYIERYGTQKCSPVFVYGESGTGKELVASALHYKSERRQKPYLPFNCAEFGGDPQLQRVEIFGCTDRIAPGVRARKGLFELSHSGTLFLDEVGALSAEAQGQLLRVLESHQVRPVGAEQFIDVDVRLICANNKPLQQLVREGSFREDLFYRFSAFIIRIPPLRERGTEDIDLLVNCFLEQENSRADSHKSFSAAARSRLHRHPWPGNVRELRATVQRAFYKVPAPDGEIGEQDLEFSSPLSQETTETSPLFPHPWQKFRDVEKEFYRQVCLWAAKNPKKHTKTLANRMIGLGKNTLNEKLKLYGLEWPK